MERRFSRLERLWPPPELQQPRLSADEQERKYLSTPALWWTICDAAENRARRRFLEPGQSAEVAWTAWGRLEEDERFRRQGYEADVLDALARDLGRALGLETWVRESVTIGLKFAGETGDYCWRMFQYSFGSLRGSLDRSRGEHLAWAAETGWRPEMPDDEFLEFEWDLLARLPALWAASSGEGANGAER